jgi:hypothetical protein
VHFSTGQSTSSFSKIPNHLYKSRSFAHATPIRKVSDSSTFANSEFSLVIRSSQFPIIRRKFTTAIEPTEVIEPTTFKEQIQVIKGTLTSIDKEYNDKFGDIVNALLKNENPANIFHQVHDLRLSEYDNSTVEIKAGFIAMEAIALLRCQESKSGNAKCVTLYSHYEHWHCSNRV